MTTALGSVKNSREKLPPFAPDPAVADPAEGRAQVTDEEAVDPHRAGPQPGGDRWARDRFSVKSIALRP
jgi:hypothetical protein